MLITRRHPALNESLALTLLSEIETIFAAGETLSVGAKQVVKYCQVEGENLILKRYKSNGPLSAIRLLLRLSRTDNSCRCASYFETFKVACPKHLLVIKQISLAKSTTYLVMEKAPGLPLFDFIQKDSTLRLSDIAINNVAQIITKMQWLGIAHGDLHTRNLIIANDNSVQIIDLDSCKKSKNRRLKDIQRFTKAVNHGARYQKELTSALDKALQQPVDSK